MSAASTRRWFVQAATLLGLSTAAPAFAADDDLYDVALDSNVGVKTRDGVRLATDVYCPARGGKPVPGRFPTILERTPYGRNVTYARDFTAADPKPKTRAEVAEVYVRHGYVVIFQDCRGCHDSEGEFIKYLSEGQDGFDTAAWLIRQP